MVQRLLLDGINAETTAAAVGGEYHPAFDVLAHKAEPPLAGLKFAQPRTGVAYDSPVGQRLPPSGRIIGLSGRDNHIFYPTCSLK
jgi:hypothetical protein